jgi:hypothetical protein
MAQRRRPSKRRADPTVLATAIAAIATVLSTILSVAAALFAENRAPRAEARWWPWPGLQWAAAWLRLRGRFGSNGGRRPATVWLATPGSAAQERAIAQAMQDDRTAEYQTVIAQARAVTAATAVERVRVVQACLPANRYG